MADELSKAERKLARLEDEALVVLAKRHPRLQQAAARMLTRRHYKSLRQFVTQRSRARGLRPEDIEDACQEIFFWITRAMAAYDPAHASTCAHFRTFLGSVITSRLSDFIKRVRIYSSHYGQWVESGDAPDAAGHGYQHDVICLFFGAHAAADPGTIAEERELHAAVRKAIDELDPADRWICDEIASGTTVPELAGKIGINYHQAWRRRQSILARLRAGLMEQNN